MAFCLIGELPNSVIKCQIFVNLFLYFFKDNLPKGLNLHKNTLFMETKKRGKKPFEDRTKVKKGIVIYLRQQEIDQLGGNAAVRKKIYDSLNA